MWHQEKIRRTVWDKWRVAVSFGMVMGASSAMNNLFVTFYLELFASVVRLDASAFYFGQLVFMAWNSSNDALFGWMSDSLNLGRSLKKLMPWTMTRAKKGLQESQLTARQHTVRRRLMMIRYGGMLWALAFVLVWIPPTISGNAWWTSLLHFSFVLCFYDGTLTLVEVNHSALLADLSTSSAERANMNMCAAVCAGLGSLSSFFGYWCWDRSGQGEMWSFQIMTTLLALVCVAVFYVASIGMDDTTSNKGASHNDEYIALSSNVPQVNDPKCNACGPDAKMATSSIQQPGSPVKWRKSLTLQENVPSLVSLILQLLSHRNFVLFQIVYFVQAFDCTFGKNHFGVFLDGLAGHVFSSQFLGLIVTASFVLPWVGTVILTPMMQRHGLFAVLGGIVLARAGWCLFSLFLATKYYTLVPSPTFTAIFILSNRIMSEAVCRICPLVMTDLVDEDRFLHKRGTSVSATIIGASQFFGKWSQSLAPMLGYYILNTQAKASHDESGDGTIDVRNAQVQTVSWSTEQQLQILTMLISIPLACVTLQALLWSSYSLRGGYLKQVKEFASREHSYDEHLDV